MLIVIAETGKKYDIKVDPNEKVFSFRIRIERDFGINLEDQLLICDKRTIPDCATLESYIKDGSKIFVFNRAVLSHEYRIPEQKLFVNTKSVIEDSFICGDNESFHVRQILKSAHFLSILSKKADETMSAILQRIELAKQGLSQRQLQEEGLEMAESHLRDQDAHLDEILPSKLAELSQMSQKHAELLQGFESSMKKLEQTPLHPGLSQSVGGHAGASKTLLDCIPENRIRSWANDCAKIHSTFLGKMSQLSSEKEKSKQLVVNYKPILQEDNVSRMFQKLEQMAVTASRAREISDFFKQQLERMKELEKEGRALDVNIHGKEIIKLCDSIKPDQVELELSQSELTKLDLESITLLSLVSDSLTEMTAIMQQNLKRIEECASAMRAINSNLEVLIAGGEKQRRDFFQLEILNNIPSAYKAQLYEIARRRKFSTRLDSEVSKFNQVLRGIRLKENSRRGSFEKRFGKYLLANISQGISEAIPHIKITCTAQFDKGLPPIDIDSLKDAIFPNDVDLGEFFSTENGVNASIDEDVMPLSTANNPANINAHNEAIEKLEKEKEAYKTRIKLLEDKFYMKTVLVKQLEEEKKRNEERATIDTGLMEKLDAAERRIGELSAKVDTYEGELVVAQAKAKQLEADAAARKAEALVIPKLKEDKEVISAELVRVKKEKAALEESVSLALKDMPLITKNSQAAAVALPNAMPTLSKEIKTAVSEFKEMESRLLESDSKMKDLRAKYERSESLLIETQNDLLITHMSMAEQKSNGSDKISIRNFQVGDLAMFFPNEESFYEAFNLNCPNHFLAEESLELFKEERKMRIGIVGKIVMIEDFQTKEGNPFKIKDSTYYTINIERL
eukprot:TRINITY_DN3567_c0_g1_i1.p1 TRINITY_DN3567_c0_g1~~TRINITY_DN3567_c0_g1_i1.p1  ORF type:complete len:852 (+),score=357.97 TRINITY_DN3567_c0_g1_i1:28-2583(+)